MNTDKSSTMIKFKIQRQSALFTGWVYFYYAKINGIGMTRSATNSFSEWTVGEIPEGAIIC